MRNILVVIFCMFYAIPAYSQANEIFYIEDFEEEETGSLPANWYNRDGDHIPATYPAGQRDTYKYAVTEEEGNKFLRYEGTRAKHLNFPLINRDRLNVRETPYLHWRWRVLDIPEGANEDMDGRNDAAASIYVVWNFGRVLFKKVPKSIRYTWSSTLPVGTELSKFYGNQKIIVVASGREGLNEWKSFQRNIVADYERLFGDRAPEKPLALLILSDGDDTRSHIIADYDDILLSSSEKLE